MKLWILYVHATVVDAQVFAVNGTREHAISFLKMNGGKHAELFEVSVGGLPGKMVAVTVDGEFTEFKR